MMLIYDLWVLVMLLDCYKPAIKQRIENYITIASTTTVHASSCVIMTFGFIYGYVVRRLVIIICNTSDNLLDRSDPTSTCLDFL